MANFLIVDDSSTMRKIISRSLRQAGLPVDEISEAGDGIEALNVLSSGGSIDLILSDINMPNMDGIEFVVQARAGGCSTPIVMITTEGGEDVIASAIAGGASGAIKKPFTPEQLQTVLGPLI